MTENAVGVRKDSAEATTLPSSTCHAKPCNSVTGWAVGVGIVIVLVIAIFGLLPILSSSSKSPSTGSAMVFTVWAMATIAVLLLAALGATIVAKMACNQIDLSLLVAEVNGDASLSRFQMLLFSFVIAALYIAYVLGNLSKGGGLPSLDPSVLGLMGISGGTYVLSKGIQKTAESTPAHKEYVATVKGKS